MDLAEILPFDLLLLLKLFYLLGLLMYLLFAVVLVRQTQMMINALNGLLKLPVQLAVWIHFLSALILFGLAVVFL